MLLFPADIEAILTQRHFGCEYQPIIQLSNESILAYEALARFRFKESLVPPILSLMPLTRTSGSSLP